MRETGLQRPRELESSLKEAATDLHWCLIPCVKEGWGQQSWPSSREFSLYVKLLNDN